MCGINEDLEPDAWMNQRERERTRDHQCIPVAVRGRRETLRPSLMRRIISVSLLCLARSLLPRRSAPRSRLAGAQGFGPRLGRDDQAGRRPGGGGRQHPWQTGECSRWGVCLRSAPLVVTQDAMSIDCVSLGELRAHSIREESLDSRNAHIRQAQPCRPLGLRGTAPYIPFPANKGSAQGNRLHQGAFDSMLHRACMRHQSCMPLNATPPSSQAAISTGDAHSLLESLKPTRAQCSTWMQSLRPKGEGLRGGGGEVVPATRRHLPKAGERDETLDLHPWIWALARMGGE